MYVNVIPRHLPVCLGESPTVADVHRIGRVDTSGAGCWEWGAHRNGLGYGLLPDIAARRLGERRATRAIMRLLGHDLTGLHVCHTCDVPACVHPDHLFVGTASDNAQDAKRKGRRKPPPPKKRSLARETEKCPTCGAEFERVVGGHRLKQHCSRKCAMAARRGVPNVRRLPRETRVCPCGAEFEARVDSDQRLCSSKVCIATYRVFTRPRADKGVPRVPRETRSCIECGDEFVTIQTSTQRCCASSVCRVAAAHRATKRRTR
jgi:hypothetical protein